VTCKIEGIQLKDGIQVTTRHLLTFVEAGL